MPSYHFRPLVRWSLCGLLLTAATTPASLQAKQVLPKLGGERQVNVQAQGDQSAPRIAADRDGNYAIAWLDSENYLRPKVYVRLFDARGAARSGDIPVVGTHDSSDAVSFLQLAMAPDGRFVVLWGADHAWARLFDAQGVALGSSIRADDVPLLRGSSAGVAMTPEGRFTVAWNAETGTPSVYLRSFDPAGEPLEAGRRIDATLPGTIHAPQVATTPLGGVIVAWVRDRGRYPSEIDDQLVAVIRPTVTGNPTDEALLNSTPGQDLWYPRQTAHADGTFSVVWEGLAYPSAEVPHDEFRLFARRFSPQGAALGPEVILPFDRRDIYRSTLATDRYGNTLVAIDDRDKLEARLFDPDWKPIGEPFDLVAFPDDQQGEPALTASGEGFVVAWSSGFIPPFEWPIPIITQDGDGFGIFSQRFAPPLCAKGSKVLCLGQDGRFELSVSWTTSDAQQGAGRAHLLTGDTGAFWFFEPSNLELMIKVLDGSAVNGNFWVFSGALSDVASTLTVRDTATGAERSYHSPQGQLVSRADTAAFHGAAPAGSSTPGVSFEAPELTPSISAAASCADADPGALCFPLAPTAPQRA